MCVSMSVSLCVFGNAFPAEVLMYFLCLFSMAILVKVSSSLCFSCECELCLDVCVAASLFPDLLSHLFTRRPDGGEESGRQREVCAMSVMSVLALSQDLCQ